MEKKSIAFLLTCYNRKEKTLQCLKDLYKQNLSNAYKVSIYLVDDGSTDGTGDAVRECFPEINILQGDGSLFWNRGMGLAFGTAIKQSYDFYVWLNDDTFLFPGSIHMLLQSYNELLQQGKGNSIVVGSTRDPATGNTSYGGFAQKSRLNPISGRLLSPNGQLQSCDKIVGNCVLIPASVVALVGNLDVRFRHRFGDVDYGYRARKQGCTLYIAPEYVGLCEDNPFSEKWKDKSLPLRKRIQLLHSVRGLPIQDWTRYTRRHGGYLWMLIWMSPYLKILFSSATRVFRTYG